MFTAFPVWRARRARGACYVAALSASRVPAGPSWAAASRRSVRRTCARARRPVVVGGDLLVFDGVSPPTSFFLFRVTLAILNPLFLYNFVFYLGTYTEHRFPILSILGVSFRGVEYVCNSYHHPSPRIETLYLGNNSSPRPLLLSVSVNLTPLGPHPSGVTQHLSLWTLTGIV